jgi:hypothetical protein
MSISQGSLCILRLLIVYFIERTRPPAFKHQRHHHYPRDKHFTAVVTGTILLLGIKIQKDWRIPSEQRAAFINAIGGEQVKFEPEW